MKKMFPQLNWKKTHRAGSLRVDVLPVVVQDFKTKRVLILAYASIRALNLTLRTRLATLYSTSRKKIWIKGKESGNFLPVIDVLYDCEGNSLLYLVELPKGGGACHIRDQNGKYRQSCFYRSLVK